MAAYTVGSGPGDYATIGAAITAAGAGDTIEIAAGTYNENLTIDKGLAFVGVGDVTIAPGSGAAVSFTSAGGGNVSFDNIDLDGTSGATRGILIDAGSDVGELSFSNGTISGFSTQGIFSTDDGDPATFPTLGSLVLDNASFADNGSGGGNTAHVKLFGFDGDATISNVTFDGAASGTAVVDRPDNAIEITGGLNAPGSANPAPASSPDIGDVTIADVTVSGEYEKNPVAIFNFAELDGLSITDLDLTGAVSTWDLFNIDGTSDSTIDATAYGIAYPSGSGVVGDLQGEKPNQPDVDTEIIGTAANEFLNGKRGNDDLDGAGGDDILVGGPGDDEVDGGDGTDVAVIVADAGGVAIGGLTPPLSFSGVTVTTDGSASFTLVGPDGEDDYTDVEVLSLRNTGSDTYYVLPGMSLEAAALAAEQDGLETGDTIVVEKPGNQVTAFVYDATGGEFQYDVALSNAPPTEGTPFDDDIDLSGETADQTLSTGDGDDFVFGGDGDDSIDGEGGNDDIRGQGGPDTVIGGEGDDVLRGNTGNDLLVGGPGSDELKGGPGIDHGVVANATEDYADVADYDFNDYSFSRDSGDSNTADFDGTLTHPDGEGETETETITGLEVMEIAETGSSTFVVAPTMNIQAAIDAASDGDTIQLLSGTHPAAASGAGGLVTVDKSVTILGPNAGISPLDPFAVRGPEATLGVRFDVTADDVTIDGVRFAGAAAGPVPVADFKGANGALLNAIAFQASSLPNDFPQVSVTGDGATVAANHFARDPATDADAPTIDASGVDAVTIDGNQVDNGWIAVGEASGAVVVTNNTVDNPNVGGSEDFEITVAGPSGGPVGSLDASGNTIASMAGARGVSLSGTPGDDDFRGYETGFADVLLGFDGNDTIEGGFGWDTIEGNLGDDSIDAGNGADEVDGGGGADTILGGQGWDTIFGGTGNDSIDGGTGRDDIEGEAGDDTLIGGSQEDSIRGASGDDSIDGGSENDTLRGNADDDTISGGNGADEVYGGIGDDSIDGGQGWDSLTGGSGDDSMIGANGKDTLVGDAGADTLRGQDQDDTLDGGAGDDSMDGGKGEDFLVGGGGTDRLTGGDGGFSDTLDGGAGTDTLVGQAGDDSLAGGGAADTLDGRSGDDTMDGGGGTDSLLGKAGEDVMDGGTGADTLDGGQSDDTVDGGFGFDVLSGGGGDDILTGGRGDDTIDGGAGLDVATYAQDLADFAITVDASGDIIVDDTLNGTVGEGTDTVAPDVELLRFAEDDPAADVTTAFLAEESGPAVTVDNIFAGLGAVTIDGVAGATDLGGGEFELAVEGGTLLVKEDGEVTFTPDGPIDGLSVGESLTVEFDMSLSDMTTTRGAVVIQGVNDAPTADPTVAVSTGENDTVAGNVLDEANAEDPDDDPIVVGAVDGTDLVGTPAAATVTGDDGGILEIEEDGDYTFDPADHFEGLLEGETADTTFEVVISDGNGGETVTELTVTVDGEDDFRSEPGDRDQPVARADRGFTIHGPEEQYLGNVIDNDFFGVGELTVVDFDKTGGSDNGTFYLDPFGRLFFEGDPDGGIPGRTTFNYTIEDQDDHRSSATIEVEFASGPSTPFPSDIFPIPADIGTDPGDTFTA